MAVTCSGRRRVCIHPCGFKDSVALTVPLHHRFTFVFFCPRRSHFGSWNLFFVPRVSGGPLFCVCVSLEKYRIWDSSGRRPPENVRILCNAWFDSGYMFILQSPEAVRHFLRESGLGS